MTPEALEAHLRAERLLGRAQVRCLTRRLSVTWLGYDLIERDRQAQLYRDNLLAIAVEARVGMSLPPPGAYMAASGATVA